LEEKKNIEKKIKEYSIEIKIKNIEMKIKKY
jgi:hypothetical protein